jgi:uncharacterized repeat protein (TIGR03803 family)
MIQPSRFATHPGFTVLACLTICTVSAAGQTLTTLYNFSMPSGWSPQTGVVIGSGPGGHPVLYGTASGSGGTVYSLTPATSGHAASYQTLYTFSSIQIGQAGYPAAPNALAIDSNGVLYGTNFEGGITTGNCEEHVAGCGSVYSLSPPAAPGGPWTETTLYDFTGGADGKSPGGGVLIGPGGVLYGTTERGGTGAGTAYSLTPPASPGDAWTEATLYTFAGGSDGASPIGTLAIDGNGVLYGTTQDGGGSHRGVVFSLTPPASPGDAWTQTVLYAFTGGADGSQPSGGVVIGGDGVLYGTTSPGGTYECGVVYSLTPPSAPGGAWTETVLYNFGHGSGQIEAYPGPLVLGTNGVLYGATSKGGTQLEGTVYALIPPVSSGSSWTFRGIYSFAPPDGNFPYFGQSLAVGSDRIIYGTTYQGGTSNLGTVFALRP